MSHAAERVPVKFRVTGETLFLNRDGKTGHYYCPVCGSLDPGDPPYWENGEGSHDICPSCGFEFGYDDQKTESFTTYEACWKAWRRKWLDEERHADWCYEQLKNIGVDLTPPESRQEMR